LGVHDDHLGKNEKLRFGAQAMQNCDSAADVSQTTMLVHRPFGLHARDILRRQFSTASWPGIKPSFVMAGLVPAIHDFARFKNRKRRRGCPA
jgi:hypothetical protein